MHFRDILFCTPQCQGCQGQFFNYRTCARARSWLSDSRGFRGTALDALDTGKTCRVIGVMWVPAPNLYCDVDAPTDVARKSRMEVYADGELHDQVEEAAEECEVSVSEWMREAARQKLQREELPA